MIKYETIISNFDDKTTLYNWLRKVEEALKHASATNFVVNKKGNATLSFSITFADGTTLESGDIVLQQGESVDDARIASGILQLHLTNGTWLTAGNIKPVSNFQINASQHLIVNYQDGTSQDLGAIFSGNVNVAGNFTADSIIENMQGYTWTKLSVENHDVEEVYVGVVKNGNKLTFVWCGYITRLTPATGGTLGIFGIPNDVGAKLYPTQIGSYEWLDAKVVPAFVNSVTYANAYLRISKSSNVQIAPQITTQDLTQNTKYFIRYEATFLLSDNMAGE